MTNILALKPQKHAKYKNTLQTRKQCFILLMEENLHHMGSIKPCKRWDKLLLSAGAGFPSTVRVSCFPSPICQVTIPGIMTIGCFIFNCFDKSKPGMSSSTSSFSVILKVAFKKAKKTHSSGVQPWIPGDEK